MLKKTVIVIGILVVVFVVIVAVQPGEYSVVRSATMAAPTPAVFEQVNHFHKWDAWSPWAKLDPTMKQTYEGPPAGTGAIYYLAGNKKVGEGRMTITDSRASDLIRIKLEFIKPFASDADTEFAFKPEASQTGVTWSMAGKKNFMSKAFGLFVNMDKMIGGDFEKGLTQLKSAVEMSS